MKKLSVSILALCVSSVLLAAPEGKTDLEKGFANPPSSACARTWWHWINDNVTAEGITADLEAMKRVGIYEAQIFNVDQGYPGGNARYMSEEWLDMFRFAAQEAGRLGMELGFNNAAGWSSTGGPWVTPEYGMQKVVWSETRLQGGGHVSVQLPCPPVNLGYYRDITVLAFPSPENDIKVGKLELKTLSGASFESGLLPDMEPVPSDATVPLGRIVDLSGAMSADGVLEWDAPAGNWTVLRLGHTPTGVENRPANATGRGLECDKMSRAAADAYWKGGIQPILDKLGDLVGTVVTNCLIDSYEVGCGNWTPGFRSEFKRLAGYDCTPYLISLAGYYAGSGEETERFLWDFRKVIGELMIENYYGYFGSRFHEYGMKFSVEPYGGPCDWFAAGSVGDIPMGEFWIGGTALLSTSKLASSVANVNGLPFTGAESFTAGMDHSRWLNHPAGLKALGDWAWSEGINRFIFHSYTHQPWEVVPGMTFHGYGLELSRHNTWWEQGRAYMSYIARSQFMLQHGRMAADVLVFAGESSPEDGEFRPDIKAAGYDYDEITDSRFYSLSVRDGVIMTPAGGRYRLLVLPEEKLMTARLLGKIEELVEAGATVIGPRPEASPSLSDMGGGDKTVREISERLWGKGLVEDVPALEKLSQMGIVPDFSPGDSGRDLLFIHRTSPDADIYFVSNQKKTYRTETCTFRVSGKVPELWNAVTGEISTLAEWSNDGECTEVKISFGPEDSFFIVFRKPDAGSVRIVSVDEEVSAPATRPLPGLEILKAEYGYFLPSGMADITPVLESMVKDGRLTASVNNGLAGDPAPGVVKEMRIKYFSGGEVHRVSYPESSVFSIPAKGEESDFKLIQVLYGTFPYGFDDQLPDPAVDVTSKVRDMVSSGMFIFTPEDVADGLVPEGQRRPDDRLHLVWKASGEKFDTMTSTGGVVDLSLHVPGPEIVLCDGTPVWKTPFEGRSSCLLPSGDLLKARSGRIPDELEVSGSWDISFPEGSGAPSEAVLDSLYSWSESDVDGIRYFSGTAVYKKKVNIPKEYLGKGRALELDLGSVKVIAEVFVNGEPEGILWREPFRTDITDALRPGENEIEIRVTNLWPNRLIGDASLPEDCDWGDWTLNSWPDWLLGKGERHSDRVTFTTWRHWKAGEPLQPSGLIGPVVLRPYVVKEMK